MTNKIGIIEFLNSYPFWYNEVTQTPSEHLFSSPPDLSSKFKSNLLSVSMISSQCYINMSDNDIDLLPFVIAGNPKTNSTFLVLSHDTSKDDIHTIQLPKNSLTTSELVKISCHHFFHIFPEFVCVDSINNNLPFVIIGDDALKIDHSKYHVIDLAELWFQQTGLPMCFGVWAKYKQINTTKLESLLDDNLQTFFLNIDTFTKAISHSVGIPNTVLYSYYKGMSYRLNDTHIKSLKLFKSLQQGVHEYT
jgi:predicted solute-binding protein